MDKPRLVLVTDQVEDAYLREHAGELDVPHVTFVSDEHGGQSLWCDPEELKAWREGRK